MKLRSAKPYQYLRYPNCGLHCTAEAEELIISLVSRLWFYHDNRWIPTVRHEIAHCICFFQRSAFERRCRACRVRSVRKIRVASLSYVLRARFAFVLFALRPCNAMPCLTHFYALFCFSAIAGKRRANVPL